MAKSNESLNKVRGYLVVDVEDSLLNLAVDLLGRVDERLNKEIRDDHK